MGFSVREVTAFLLPSGLRRTTKIVAKARMGVDNPDWEQTLPDRRGGANPEWEDALMQLPRWGKDEDTLVLELWEFKRKSGQYTWLGGNHLNVQKYMDAPNDEFEEEVKLYVSGDSTGGAGSGIVKMTVQWVPDPDDIRVDGLPGGNLHVTPSSAAALKKPDKIVRDLSTYVDYTSAYVALLCFGLYLLTGFMFYQGFMAAPIKLGGDLLNDPETLMRQEALLDKIQGGRGGWDTINTLVFMVTSFTTVGYGNQPSMVATTPPCEYGGGPAILSDAPFSVLLPKDIRGSKVAIGKMIGVNRNDDAEETNFAPLPATCFPKTEHELAASGGIGGQDGCRVLADERHIFHFTTRQLYARGEISPPRNFSTDSEQETKELRDQRMPGDTGLYDCADVDPTKGNETIGECYERFVKICESSLQVWRALESKKNVSKGFTVIFVMFGIGILGAVVGVFGETLKDWANNLFEGAEAALDTAMTPVASATGVTIEDVAGSGGKGIFAAFFGLSIVVGLGTAVYATVESMKVIDAVYFTVVTATTLGFGDYCPETYAGKVFTLFFVPISVVAVAGAIEHVASVPLNSRKAKLENYVLAQFGDSLTLGDLVDLRRSARLSDAEAVKKNDFLLAMMIRLGYINYDDTKAILNIFSKLDINQNGAITDEDVMDSASNGATKSNGAAKSKQSEKDARRERNLFDEEAPPKVAPRVKRVSSTDTTSNPVASSSKAAPPKKASMVLGDENPGEKVRGADGKVRRKVKKPKKPNSDEV